jgi:hypothetical protein
MMEGLGGGPSLDGRAKNGIDEVRLGKSTRIAVIAPVNAMAVASPKRSAAIEPIIDEVDDLPPPSHDFSSGLALVSGHARHGDISHNT